MTDKNIRLAVTEELTRAKQAEKAADLLYDNGLFADAVSKLYYYVLYYIRALLLTRSVEPKSHEGALRLFSLYFIKQGTFDAGVTHIFTRLMKYREEADYKPAYTFTKEDFESFRGDARSLTAAAETYLSETGFTQR